MDDTGRKANWPPVPHLYGREMGGSWHLHAHDGLLLGGFVAHDCDGDLRIKGLRGDAGGGGMVVEVEERMEVDVENLCSRKGTD